MTQPARTRKPVADMSEDEFTNWLCALPPHPVRDDIDDETADAEALADFAAGRCHSHEIVSEWLRTWGSPESKPFKEWLADRHG